MVVDKSATSDRARPAREVEAKLIARDATLLDAVAALGAIGGYELRPAGAHALPDRQFDTPDRTLGSRRLALRIREQDGQALFTLKWPNAGSGALFDRPELELPLSKQASRHIRVQLEQAGVALNRQPCRVSDPQQWLEASGLSLTQERWTERRLLLAHRAGRLVAELALDRVRYQFGIYEVVYHEIEVESRTAADLDVLTIARLLERAYPGRLAPGQRGKYSRGLALSAALEPLQA
jgi:inorganic triphosphatase YgiF